MSSPAAKTRRLDTAPEVAQRLQVKPGTLAQWRWRTRRTGIQHGPKWIKVGTVVRYDRDDVDTYLATRAGTEH
jgi:predicted DNA-binding transcriptional regulator AlpA